MIGNTMFSKVYMKIKEIFKGFMAGALYIVCNYIIQNIPCWTIRKFLYRVLGMKIGKNSRIMMKTIITIPWNIEIGSNTIINEHCYLDGRGVLKIGDNVNIALYSMIITGSHKINSEKFEYYTESVVIENDVWLAARSSVLNGCLLKKGTVVCCGSVVKPHTICEKNSVWSGVPAVQIFYRDISSNLQIERWNTFFR